MAFNEYYVQWSCDKRGHSRIYLAEQAQGAVQLFAVEHDIPVGELVRVRKIRAVLDSRSPTGLEYENASHGTALRVKGPQTKRHYGRAYQAKV